MGKPTNDQCSPRVETSQLIGGATRLVCTREEHWLLMS